jgi:hypothetical protein
LPRRRAPQASPHPQRLLHRRRRPFHRSPRAGKLSLLPRMLRVYGFIPSFVNFARCASSVQHFEVSEVGMLARCLCVPLVSLRVGKVQRDGALLCPTPIRLVATQSFSRFI